MRHPSLLTVFCSLLLLCCHTPASAPRSTESAGQERALEFREGLLPLCWDAEEQRLLLQVPELGKALLYVVSLPRGLGSNDVGLDRGQLGDSRLVEFRRVGDRVLLVAPNQDWRSSSRDASVRTGTRRAFAISVLGSFAILDESSGSPCIDITEFCLRDAHGIVSKLKGANQGDFHLDPERSLVLPDSIKAFAGNIALEVLQTFSSDRPGAEVRATTPAPNSLSLRVRHAFVALPDLEIDPYQARVFHPRSGYFVHAWNDANTPLGEDTRRRVVQRHRVSRAQPLVYHIDRATPEPMRSALLAGAKFWEPVFDQALFPGAFRVELLPEDADPDDVRWNIVQWVERSTRGWSYGSTLVDPRTGEILKGHVTLGALRVRQDVLLFEGLMAPWADGQQDPEVREAALARIRQLAAHEIGHTLGLAHNFAASFDGRASVMDYPAPLVLLREDGSLDLSDAYAPGCGAWDLFTIRYGYGVFDDEAGGLSQLLADVAEQGLHYASDQDARGDDRAHPLANLWDNGTDAVDQLEHDLAVRAVALARFSKGVIAPSRPLFELERALVPLYLGHRYQVEAVARLLGGRWYDYNLGGEDDSPIRPTSSGDQSRALIAMLGTLEPRVLALDPKLVAQIPPPPPGYGRDRETFRANGPLFDPLEAAGAAADHSLALLLNPSRCARLVDQHRADPEVLGLIDVLDALQQRWFPKTSPAQAWIAEEQVVRSRLLEQLMLLADAPRAADRVRALVLARLDSILGHLVQAPKEGSGSAADLLYESRLRHFLEDPRNPGEQRPSPSLPPGSPIGLMPFRCSMQ